VNVNKEFIGRYHNGYCEHGGALVVGCVKKRKIRVVNVKGRRQVFMLLKFMYL
jgi:hypothetical protein